MSALRDKRIILRVTVEEKQRMEAAARGEGMSLSAWIRWVCRRVGNG